MINRFENFTDAELTMLSKCVKVYRIANARNYYALVGAGYKGDAYNKLMNDAKTLKVLAEEISQLVDEPQVDKSVQPS